MLGATMNREHLFLRRVHEAYQMHPVPVSEIQLKLPMIEQEAQFAGAPRSMTEDAAPQENRPRSNHSAILRGVVGMEKLRVRLPLASRAASKKLVE